MSDVSGTEPSGTEPGGTEPGGTEPGGTEPGGTEPGGTEPGGQGVRGRVLLVLATSTGGVGRHVAALLPLLPGAGWRPQVAAPSATLQQFMLPALAPSVAVEIPAAPHPRADARAVRALRSVLAGLGAGDVVHAHGIRAGFVALAALRTVPARRRPGLVVTLHNAVLAAGARGLLGRTVEAVVARGADVVLAVSGDLVRRARAAGARDAARALVPAPASRPPRRTPAEVRARLGTGEAPLLLTVARLAPQKGLPLLLDALGRLRAAEGPPEAVPVLLVAGDGPLRAELEARAAAEALPVRWLGARRDVADLLAAADVVVSSSEWEGQPLAVQEALRAGAALVATDVGGVGEVTGDAAVLVPVDAQALAAAVRGLLADPQARRDLRERALRRAAQLPTEEEALAQVADAYARAARRRRGVG